MSNSIKICARSVLKDVFNTAQIKSMVNDEQRTFREKRVSPKGVEYNLMVSKVGNDDYAVWATKSEIRQRTVAHFFYTDSKWINPYKNHQIIITD